METFKIKGIAIYTTAVWFTASLAYLNYGFSGGLAVVGVYLILGLLVSKMG